MIAQPINVFPDTNVFLHYRAIDQIDWLMLIKARPIQIKIAPVLGRELEEKRIEHSFRDRATSAIKLLRNYIGQAQVRDGVTLEFLTDDPTLEYASKRNLNLLLADDRLIVERRCRTCYRNANSREAKRGAFCTFGSDSAVFNGIESTLMY